MVIRRLSTAPWNFSHSIACWVISLLLQVLPSVVICASRVIFGVAALASSWCTDWSLHCCSVPASDVLDEESLILFHSDPLSPGWSVCVALICWSGKGVEDDNEKKWEVLRTISYSLSPNGMRNSQLPRSTHDESCCIHLHGAGVSNHPAICSMSVWCSACVYRDIQTLTTVEIMCLSDVNNKSFPGNDIWWCLSQWIPRIIHETDTKNQVILNG